MQFRPSTDTRKVKSGEKRGDRHFSEQDRANDQRRAGCLSDKPHKVFRASCCRYFNAFSSSRENMFAQRSGGAKCK